jgi:hypothetical protein
MLIGEVLSQRDQRLPVRLGADWLKAVRTIHSAHAVDTN